MIVTKIPHDFTMSKDIFQPRHFFFSNLFLKDGENKTRKPSFAFLWTDLSSAIYWQTGGFIPRLTFINGAALTVSPVSLIFHHLPSAPSGKTAARSNGMTS